MDNEVVCANCGKSQNKYGCTFIGEFAFCPDDCRSEWLNKCEIGTYVFDHRNRVAKRVRIMMANEGELSDPNSDPMILLFIGTSIHGHSGDYVKFDIDTKRFFGVYELRDGTYPEFTYENGLEVAERVIQIINGDI